MTNPTRNTNQSRMANGFKAGALAVVLGLVAVVTQPAMTTDEWLAVPAAVAPAAAPISVGNADYFPSHYPAPTTPAESMPTF